MKYLPLFIAICLPIIAASQTRFYVTQTATGANTGATWQDAFTNLQTALQTAVSGDTVWVAEGTYYPTDTADRFVSFEPKSGVRLYGGFAGTETSLDQRDWQAHSTVLSGDIGVLGDSTDNSLNVMYLHHTDSFTVVDGFTMRDGVADFTGGLTSSRHRNKCGGGLYIEGKDWEAYPTIRNCKFVHNTARNFGGGAMVNGEGLGSIAPKFYNCTFENNICVANGGGLAWLGASWVEREKDIENCTFIINIAQRGGGFYFTDSEKLDKLDIFNCTFEMNNSMQVGGGLVLQTGRLAEAKINIDGNSFIKNTSNGSAETLAAFQNQGTVIKEFCFKNNKIMSNVRNTPGASILMSLLGDSTSLFLINQNLFSNNNFYSSFLSLDVTYGRVIICNNIIDSNIIGFNFIISADSLLFFNNILRDNEINNTLITSILDYGEGFFLNNEFYNTKSDIEFIVFFGKTILLENNTIINSDIYTSNLDVNVAIIDNSIIEDGNFSSSWLNSSPTTISHSYIPGLDCSTLPPNVNCGPGIITSGDPLFVNPDSNDFRLQPCSPLRDAGANAAVPPYLLTDLDGRPRILGGTVDIGAYEIPDFAATFSPAVQGACTDATNGSVVFETEGGCPPFTYLWQPGNGGGSAANGLAPGTYAFTVVDASGRTFLDTVAVPELPAPEIRADSMPISCYGEADALLAVAPFNGPEPFTFLWTGGVTDSIFGPVGPGAWSVTATDANGCFTTYTYYLTAPDSLQFSAVVENATGPAAPDGSVAVTAVLGGTGPYAYLWSDGSTGPVLSNVLPGTYTVTITDTRGCTAVSTYEVSFTIGTNTPGNQIAFSLFPNPAEHTVWLEIGGSGTYLLEMYDASGRIVLQRNVVSGRQQVQLAGLASGTYLAVVKNEMGEAVGRGRLVVK